MDDDGKKVWDPLADALGIESDLTGESKEIKLSGRPNTEVNADYDIARQIVMDTLLKASDSLEEIAALARASQTPRSYEVVATLSNVIINGSKDLLELSKKKVDIEKASGEEPSGPHTVNNNLILTTDGLHKMLSDAGIETKTRVMKKDDSTD